MGTFTAVVIDFETTGLSPGYGDRAIEVGAVLVSEGRIKDRYQSLINPERHVSGFIEQFTGISNAMLATAPAASHVMEQLLAFIGKHPLVAHNASFDARFLDAELQRVRRSRNNPMACSLLAARRLYPEACNHRLETLVRYKGLPNDGVHHRALADAEMTARLWLRMIDDIKTEFGIPEVTFALMQQLTRVPCKKVPEFMAKVST